MCEGKVVVLSTHAVLAIVGHVQKTIFVFMVLVYHRHARAKNVNNMAVIASWAG